jgi:glycosidase
MLERRFYFQFDDMKKNWENFQQNNKFSWIYIIKKNFQKLSQIFCQKMTKFVPKNPLVKDALMSIGGLWGLKYWITCSFIS